MPVRRQLDAKSEREAIIDEEPSVDESRRRAHDEPALRDGAAPCCVLTAMLLAAAALGGFAVYISIAAFDPDHSDTTLALMARPSTASTNSSGGKAAGGSRSGGGKAAGGFSVESKALDVDTWQVSAVKNSAGHALTFAEAVEALSSGALGPYLNSVIAGSPHKAFFWEAPPTTLALARSRPFEFVTVRAASLEGIEADSGPFSAQLGSCAGAAEGRSFSNLGGDATLVSPCAATGVPEQHYAHVAAFVRGAPVAQRDSFWRSVGTAAAETLRRRGEAPTWINTEGSGVSWLHVRLDSTPKYYHFEPYMTPPTDRAAQSKK